MLLMEEVKKHEKTVYIYILYTLDYPTDIIQSTFFAPLSLFTLHLYLIYVDVLQHTHTPLICV